MKYKGIELKEITESQIFDPPRMMFVWDNANGSFAKTEVCAFIRGIDYPVISRYSMWRHCAEIPEPKLATYRELARWLAEGKGQFLRKNRTKFIYTDIFYDDAMADDPVEEAILVRKWDDTGWRKPTREYLGLEGE